MAKRPSPAPVDLEPVQTCHDLGVACPDCGGKGVETEEAAAAHPGCPFGLEWKIPLGPAALKMSSARERKEAKERAAQLKPLRATRRWTQADLAAHMGTSRSFVAMMETGRMGCSAELLNKARARG